MFKPVLHVVQIMATCFIVYAADASAIRMEDPLRPPEYQPSKAMKSDVVKKPSWSVNEILFSGERRVAIVNNVAVAIGDSINGALVSDIKPEYVVLKYKGKVINLRLKTMSVKKQAIRK